MRGLLHFYPVLLCLLALAAIAAGGLWPFLLLAWLFYGQALAEWAFGNRFPARDPAPAAEPWPLTLALLLTVPLVPAVLGYGLHRLTAAEPGWADLAGIGLLIGVTTGSFGITAAHELVHRRQAWQRGCGILLLLLAHIPHFRIEHVHNHHAHVGTPKDPATARLGESLYAFFPRSIAGQYRSAWRVEAARLRRRNRPALGAGNRMLHYVGLQLALDVAVLLVFGWAGLALFLAQGLVAVWLLESVNYVEHYGLVRRPNGRGGWEPLAGRHSWNAGHAATNAALYNLGLHSAHHMEAARPYPALYNDPADPQLPAGYAGAVLTAMVPPLWHRKMDPRAAAVNAAP